MYVQTKYKSEIKTAVLGGWTMTIKNLTPMLSFREGEKRRREVEQQIFGNMPDSGGRQRRPC